MEQLRILKPQRLSRFYAGAGKDKSRPQGTATCGGSNPCERLALV
jgi:hypothetical protein